MTAARPASPASWVPGATCCQRRRKRMKILGRRRLDALTPGPARSSCASGPAAGGTPTRVSAAVRRCSGPGGRSPPAAARPGRPPPGRAPAWSPPASSSTVVMPLQLEMAAHHAGPRRRRRRRRPGGPRRRDSVVHHSSIAAGSDRLGPAPARQLVPQRPPLLPGRGGHQRGQQVVQIVGGGRARARSRRAPARWPRDRGRRWSSDRR